MMLMIDGVFDAFPRQSCPPFYFPSPLKSSFSPYLVLQQRHAKCPEQWLGTKLKYQKYLLNGFNKVLKKIPLGRIAASCSIQIKQDE